MKVIYLFRPSSLFLCLSLPFSFSVRLSLPLSRNHRLFSSYFFPSVSMSASASASASLSSLSSHPLSNTYTHTMSYLFLLLPLWLNVCLCLCLSRSLSFLSIPLSHIKIHNVFPIPLCLSSFLSNLLPSAHLSQHYSLLSPSFSNRDPEKKNGSLPSFLSSWFLIQSDSFQPFATSINYVAAPSIIGNFSPISFTRESHLMALKAHKVCLPIEFFDYFCAIGF